MTTPATNEAVLSHDPAILFIVFNRLDTAREVMQAIARQRPSRLYIAGDGPRAARPDEHRITREVRDAVTAMIDWPCDVRTLFQDQNLGCRHGVKAAIDWFFANEEEGIILEDDVVPCPDFFRFCAAMLERYRDDPKVMMVSGTNPLGEAVSSSRYFFSSLGSIWGWASWRSAWSRYDVDMSGWGAPVAAELRQRHGRQTARYLKHVFDFHRNNDVDTWDTQWTYTMQVEKGLAVMAEANLIRNIGVVGAHSSTETRNHNRTYGKIQWPLDTPPGSPIDNEGYKRQLTKAILNGAMLLSLFSRLSRQLRLHGIMRAGYQLYLRLRGR